MRQLASPSHMSGFRAAPRKSHVDDRAGRLTLAATCLAVFLVQLDTTIVNLALAPIQQALRTSVETLQWIIAAYAVLYASSILTGGALGDLYGRRRVFAVGVALFTLGSLLCALAPSAGMLVATRALTGLGAALTLPGSLSLLRVAYDDPGERARAIGIWAGVNGVAVALGPAIGGLLVEGLGWRSIFFIGVPVGLATLGLTLRGVRESADPQGRHLDLPAQGLAALGLGALAFGVIQGSSWGWTAGPTILCLLVSSGSLAALIVVERRSAAPLIPLGLFRRAPFSGAVLVVGLMTFGMYGMLFLLPLYLQTVLHRSSLEAGLDLMPLGLAFAVVSPAVGRVVAVVGPRLLASAGMTLSGLAMLGLAQVSTATGSALLPIDLAVIGVALGLETGPLMAVAVANVPPARAGLGSSLVNAGRMTGATLGVAVLGAVLAAHLHDSSAPGPFLAGLHAALTIGAIALLLGGALSYALIGADALHPAHSSLEVQADA